MRRDSRASVTVLARAFGALVSKHFHDLFHDLLGTLFGALVKPLQPYLSKFTPVWRYKC